MVTGIPARLTEPGAPSKPRFVRLGWDLPLRPEDSRSRDEIVIPTGACRSRREWQAQWRDLAFLLDYTITDRCRGLRKMFLAFAFWVAQRRGPQQARSWLVEVEAVYRCDHRLFFLTALAAEGFIADYLSGE